jgi:hypothetical protein
MAALLADLASACPSLPPSEAASLVTLWREVWRVVSLHDTRNLHRVIDGRLTVPAPFDSLPHPLTSTPVLASRPDGIGALVAAGLVVRRFDPFIGMEKIALTEEGVEFCYDAEISPRYPLDRPR